MNFTRPCRIALALLACAAAFAALPAQAQPELSGNALLAALRSGGYILYFRHTSTDFSKNDFGMTSYEDCATQRNLSDRGRAEARAIGDDLRALGIPVSDVLASPFCRTIETAQLIFGRATPTLAARGGPEYEQPAAAYADLRELLAKPVPPGSNLAVVSHGNPFHALVGGKYLEEGEAAVLLPGGKDGFRVVARVRLEKWRSLAAPPK